jgi:hypothetical protein
MTWHPEDKEWLKERKVKWLELKKSYLEPHSWFKQKDMKQLRHYFLTGEEDADNPLPDHNGKSFAKYPVPLFIKLWFYPEPSIDFFRELIKASSKRELKDCFSSIGSMNSIYVKSITMDTHLKNFG